MKRFLVFFIFLELLCSCNKKQDSIAFAYDNPELELDIPADFPELNSAFYSNQPTQYGVELGKKLFNDPQLSANNTISCASCHQQEYAFADTFPQAVGIYGRIGLRNAPALQNLAFLKFYNWDGSKLQLEKQPLVPIITHEEMNSSILEVIGKLEKESDYVILFRQAFGNDSITPERIYKSIAQYEYTLISHNSKYDSIMHGYGASFTETESLGYSVFKEKCADCHSTELFTDQSFRNVGFPLNTSADEAGRARVTGVDSEYMAFRVPSLRNAAYTAPYGSFGQFPTLKSVLDYFSNGVLASDNLDPVLKKQGNKIPLTEKEKEELIAFIKTLSDKKFAGR